MKEELFFGYLLHGEGAYAYRMASPEKALLDFLYMRSDIQDEGHIAELRIATDVYRDKIDDARLDSYLKIFNSPTLENKVRLVREYILDNHD